MAVAALVEEFTVLPNETLLREGAASRNLFVVIEGRGVAELAMGGGWLCLGVIGPADAAGWSSLVGAHVYPASVRALTEMRVGRIDSEGLTTLMDLDPALGYSVSKRLSSLFCLQYQAALEALRTNAWTDPGG